MKQYFKMNEGRQWDRNVRWHLINSCFYFYVCFLLCFHLFYSRHKLFGNIWPKCCIWKLQLSVVLWLQRLQDTDHFSILACTTRLLFMCKLKPKRDVGEKKKSTQHYVLTKSNHSYHISLFPLFSLNMMALLTIKFYCRIYLNRNPFLSVFT